MDLELLVRVVHVLAYDSRMFCQLMYQHSWLIFGESEVSRALVIYFVRFDLFLHHKKVKGDRDERSPQKLSSRTSPGSGVDLKDRTSGKLLVQVAMKNKFFGGSIG